MCTSKRFASCIVFRTSLLAPGLRQASTGSSLRFAHNASTHLIQQVLLTSYEPMQNTSVFATKARCKARCIWMHLDIPSPSPKCVIPWEPQVFFCGVSAHLTVISWVDLVLELPCRFSIQTFAKQQLVASFFLYLVHFGSSMSL